MAAGQPNLSAKWRPARLLPYTAALLKLAGQLLGKADQIDRLLGSLQVDSSKIRRELDWQPPFTLQEGLQVTAELSLVKVADRDIKGHNSTSFL